ncbi:hypothetical protein MNBD_GAMMA23-2245 [hydrothermal vent metagenome]|uniref:DUF4124 domain-containing protein n=1 Tax=hydrothermal vent metagenome TaxID=652676 RepID=A0A3B1AEY8_9ZZZZ
MIKFLFIIFLFSGYFFLDTNSAQAEIYKCKDKDGVINFTSVPCGQKSVGIKRPKTKVEFNKDGTKKTRKQIREEKLKREREFLETSKREREDKEQKRKKLQQHQNKLKKNCDRAKNDLNGYQTATRVYSRDKNGRRKILSDDERKKGQLDAQRRISYWCRE